MLVGGKPLLKRREDFWNEMRDSKPSSEKEANLLAQEEKGKRIQESIRMQTLADFPTEGSRCTKLHSLLAEAFPKVERGINERSLVKKERTILCQTCCNSPYSQEIIDLSKKLLKIDHFSWTMERCSKFDEIRELSLSTKQVIKFITDRMLLIGEAIVYEVPNTDDKEGPPFPIKKKRKHPLLSSDFSIYPKRSEYQIFSKDDLPIVEELLRDLNKKVEEVLFRMDWSLRNRLKGDFKATTDRIRHYIEDRAVMDSFCSIYSAGLISSPSWKVSFHQGHYA
jgi:hypothetical protein